MVFFYQNWFITVDVLKIVRKMVKAIIKSGRFRHVAVN